MGCGSSVNATQRSTAVSSSQRSAAPRNKNTSDGSGAAVPPVVLPATCYTGISLRGLRRLRPVLEAAFGSAFPDATTNDVNEKWVKPNSVGRRCRLVEMSEFVDPSDVGIPMYFISHAWKNRFVLLLDYVEQFLTNAGDSTRVWIDIFAVNQHSASPEQAADVAAFSDVVRASSAGTIVVMDVANCNPATRAWCIYEWAATLGCHGPDGLHMQLLPADRQAVCSSLDVNQAECFFEKDKQMIMRSVDQQHGSAEAFNTKLRLQILLEPLSYAVDVRRLNERSVGTQWRWEGFDQWLGEGPTGRRVLCIAAGAGEGKSSVSAALCTRLGAEGEGQQRGQRPGSARSGAKAGAPAAVVTAQHFLKYNDRRRLDPVRIVKSLAFQLANKLPEVRSALLALNATAVARMSLDQAFGLMLMEPLTKYDAAADPNAQVLLLLDALDEADPQQQQQQQPRPQDDAGSSGGAKAVPNCPTFCGNAALQLLTELLHLLPRRVRFWLTTRPDAAQGQVLASLQRTFGAAGGGVHQLRPADLRVETRPSSGSVAKGKPRSASDGSSSGSGSGGGGGGGGVMVYYTVADAYRSQGSVSGAKGTGGPPRVKPLGGDPTIRDLYDLYDEMIQAAWASYSEDQSCVVSDLIAAVLAAQEPLSQSFLQQLGLGEDATLELLPGWPTLFYVAEHSAYVFHKSLGDYLLDRCCGSSSNNNSRSSSTNVSSRSSGPSLDLQRGHYLIAMCLARARQPAPTPYTLRYLIEHLAAATWDPLLEPSGPPSAATTCSSSTASQALALLDQVLFDFTYMQAAIDAGSGPLVVRALEGMRRQSAVSREVLIFLRTWLHQLVGAGSLVEVVLKRAPLTSLIHGAASMASGCPWRTRVVLPNASHVMAVRSAEGAARETAIATAEWPTSEAVFRAADSMLLSVALSPDSKQLVLGTIDKIFVFDSATGRTIVTLQPSASVPPPREVRELSRAAHSGISRASGSSSMASSSRASTAAGARHPNDDSAAASASALALKEGSSEDNNDNDDDGGGNGNAGGGDAGGAHLGEVRGLSFSPSGHQLAAAGGQGRLQILDVATGQVVLTLDRLGGVGQTGGVNCVRFSPDGLHLVSTSDRIHTYVHEAATGRLVRVLQHHEGEVNSAAFSADGRLMATGAEDCVIWVYDTVNWSRANKIDRARGGGGHNRRIVDLAFNPSDSTQLASADDAGVVCVWRLAPAPTPKNPVALSASLVRQLEGTTGNALFALAFAPDGASLACGMQNGSVLLYDIATWAPVATLKEHNREVRAVLFSHDGQRLVSGHQDGTAAIFNLNGVALGRTSSPSAFAAGVDAAVAARSESGEDQGTGAEGCGPKLEGLHGRHVLGVACQPGGDHVAIAVQRPSGPEKKSSTGVEVYDGSTGRLLRVPAVPQGLRVQAVAYSGDGTHMVLGCSTKLLLYDVLAGYSAPKTYTGNITLRRPLGAMAVGQDVSLLIHSRDTSVYIDDCINRKFVAELPGHKDVIRALACSPDGNYIASGSDDMTVRIHRRGPDGWLPSTAVLSGFSDWLRGVAFSSDSCQLAAGGDDSTIRFFRRVDGGEGEPPKWQLVRKLETAMGVNSIVYGVDGRVLAAGCDQGNLEVYDTAATLPYMMSSLRGHTEQIATVAFSSRGDLVSGGHEGFARVWSTEGRRT